MGFFWFFLAMCVFFWGLCFAIFWHWPTEFGLWEMKQPHTIAHVHEGGVAGQQQPVLIGRVEDNHLDARRGELQEAGRSGADGSGGAPHPFRVALTRLCKRCQLLPAHQSVRLPVCLSACLPVCLSACLSVGLSVCRSVGLSVCRSVGLSVCRSVGLSVCRSVGLSVCRSVGLSVCRSVGLSVCLSVWLSVCLSVCLSLSLSLSLTHEIHSFGEDPPEISIKMLRLIIVLGSPSQNFKQQNVCACSGKTFLVFGRPPPRRSLRRPRLPTPPSRWGCKEAGTEAAPGSGLWISLFAPNWHPVLVSGEDNILWSPWLSLVETWNTPKILLASRRPLLASCKPYNQETLH